ncbi:MAG TPA: hypothetical protein VD866_13365 [Urbifossiella sp.]|nr:hypothetical protein [Urbifossiella sp.]
MLLALFLTSVGCGRPVNGPTEKSPAPTPEAEPLDRAQVTKNLVAHAEESRRAEAAEDYERLGDLTHPALIRQLGGRAQFHKAVREAVGVINKAKAAGVRFKPSTIREPIRVADSNGKWYGVVPYDWALIEPDGTQEDSTSNLFGESVDGGRTWTFVDGEGVGGDRARLKQVMPDFPDSLPVPASK